jgi:hypothetical protein
MNRPAMKRTIALGAAWTASAAAAVGLGFLAVSLVDASAAPGTRPVAASTTASSGSSSTTAAAPGVTSREHTTVGGTVFASCAGNTPSLAGAPATGWWVDDPAAPGQVEFRNGTQKVEVHTVCIGDVPQFSVEGPRADGSGRDDGSTDPASPSSDAASPTSGPDDSSGRDGGGHGSDDPPGDDPSGRGGGGHGSDG